MRTLLIFLSIGVFFTWIHCSSGAPRNIRFLASNELQAFMKKFSNDASENSASHESVEEEENEKKIIDTNDSNSRSSEEANLDEDNEAILPPLIDIHHKQMPEDNEEN